MVRTLLRLAASVFSLTPPMGSILPVRDTSPAMCLRGQLVEQQALQLTMQLASCNGLCPAEASTELAGSRSQDRCSSMQTTRPSSSCIQHGRTCHGQVWLHWGV